MVKPLDALNVMNAFRGQHGRPTHDAIHSRLQSVSFGSLQVAVTYASNPNNRGDVVIQPHVIEAHFRIERPLPLDAEDPFMDASLVLDLMGQDRGLELLLRHASHIYNTGKWDEEFAQVFDDVKDVAERAPHRLRELYLDAWTVLDDRDFVCVAKKMGFDGAAFGGTGASALTTEYRVFSREQISIVRVMDLTAARRYVSNMERAAAA